MMEKEYEMLRAEILQNLNIMHNLLSITYVAVSGIFAYIFNNMTNPLLFTSIYIILIPIAAKIYALANCNDKISSYMEVFLEPNIEHINWETNSHYKDNNKISIIYNRTETKNKILYLSSRDNSSTFLIGLANYILFMYIFITYFEWKFIIGGLINTFSLLALLYFYKDTYSLKNRELFIEKWNEIKEFKLNN